MNPLYIIIGCAAMFSLGWLVGAFMAGQKVKPTVTQWEERHDEYPPDWSDPL